MALQYKPTRMELSNLKKRRTVAIRGHKMMKDKRDELVRRLELFSDMTTHQEVKATEIYSLTVLEIRSQKSRFGRVGSF